MNCCGYRMRPYPLPFNCFGELLVTLGFQRRECGQCRRIVTIWRKS
jgi:hypothetical protein